ncbi:MAG: hypothetical protein K2X90_01130 [Candidatus Babeliaceae bacterium]|nr:hypothetical protein [Candidatus Babeliaceae bacterium]
MGLYKIFIFTLTTLSLNGMQSMQQEIENALLSSPIKDFDAFPETVQGQELAEKIKNLTQEEKNELLKKLSQFYLPHNPAEPTYAKKAPYLKLICLSGAEVNYNFERRGFRQNLLSNAIMHNHEKMVKFLLEHNAKTQDTDYISGPLLNITKSYPLAQLLVKYDALKPYADNTELQKQLLISNFSNSSYDSRLIRLYKKELKQRYNIQLDARIATADNQETLLQALCKSAHSRTQVDFFDKLLMLLQEGAVDLSKRNFFDSPQNIIQNQLNDYPDNATLQLAHKLLSELYEEPNLLKLFSQENKQPTSAPAITSRISSNRQLPTISE